MTIRLADPFLHHREARPVPQPSRQDLPGCQLEKVHGQGAKGVNSASALSYMWAR